MARRGNPYAVVRLEPDVMDQIKNLAPPGSRGRGGGVSQYLRQLVYEHLGLGTAPCFGEPETTKKTEKSRMREPRAAPELC